MSNHVLLEIGLEELPARFIDNAEQQLYDYTVNWLDDMHIEYGVVQTFSTPRRLTVRIEKIATYQTTINEEVRGPQLKIAKDENGEWTKAAVGFCKGQGQSPDDIYVKKINDSEYIFIEKKTEGKETISLLPELKEIVSSIHFPQTMRWGNNTYRYARPIRWLVAVCNDQIIPFEIAGVKTGNTSHGHRFLGDSVTIVSPLDYEQLLEDQYVYVSPLKREQIILHQIKEIEEKEGFHIQVEPALLNEVRNLVEYPTTFFGTFSEKYLQLPEEALITSMAEHQRYFPVMNKQEHTLLPYFVSVRNGDEQQIGNVVKGNEKVLRARLADAAFFYDEDRSESIEFYNDKLKTVIFQEKLGTIYEKVQHVISLTEKINNRMNITEEVASQAVRTAQICKFDLMTSMVGEFPELQGIMGEKYAMHFGEDPTVARAVKEHYYPIQSNGQLPSNDVAAIVSIADKLDTIVSSIAVGLIPSGSQDPHGLRRQAIGVLRILEERKWDITVEELLAFAVEQYQVSEQAMEDIHTFFRNRAAFLLSKQGIEQDVTHAVIDHEIGVFGYTLEKASLLSAKRNDDTFKPVQEALVRVMNLSKKATAINIDTNLFETASEQVLYDNLMNTTNMFHTYNGRYDAQAALQELEKLAEPIHDFFENNMVMAEDEKVKQNRLSLLQQLANIIVKYADVTLIEWKQHQ